MKELTVEVRLVRGQQWEVARSKSIGEHLIATFNVAPRMGFQTMGLASALFRAECHDGHPGLRWNKGPCLACPERTMSPCYCSVLPPTPQPWTEICRRILIGGAECKVSCVGTLFCCMRILPVSVCAPGLCLDNLRSQKRPLDSLELESGMFLNHCVDAGN